MHVPNELGGELFARSRKKRGYACGCEQLEELDAVDRGLSLIRGLKEKKKKSNIHVPHRQTRFDR